MAAGACPALSPVGTQTWPATFLFFLFHRSLFFGEAQKALHRTSSLLMPSAHRLTQAMHLPARLPGSFFLPATQAANFLLFNPNIKHGNEGCCSSGTSTSTSISAVKKATSTSTAGEANIAATDRLEPAGEPSKKGRTWRSRACHPLPASQPIDF